MMTLREIKNSISMEELFRRDGHKLIKSSNHFVCLCPFHMERTPSCAVYPDHFYCFGCATGGDQFNYVMKRDGCGFKEAMAKLNGGAFVRQYHAPIRTVTKKTDSSPDFESMMKTWMESTSDSQMSHLSHFANTLNVSPESLRSLGCAWAPTYQAWAFPMSNGCGKIVGIRLRREDGLKFAVKGSHDGLFVPVFMEPITRLFITEGPTDCAAADSMNLDAIGRANALSNACIDQCVEFVARNKPREVVVVADNDEVGKVGARKLRQALTAKSRQLLFPTKDFREFLRVCGSQSVLDVLLRNQI